MIEITLLGTGSPRVDPKRAGPSTLVAAGGQTFLVDCGRGALMRAAAAGVGAANLTALLLTHLHSDHITDLSDVITTRWVTTFVPTPLPIIGPPGTRAVVDATLAAATLLALLEGGVHQGASGDAALVWNAMWAWAGGLVSAMVASHGTVSPAPWKRIPRR